MNQFFRSLIFDIKYLFCEIGLKLKHPTRSCDIFMHLNGIYRTVISHPVYCLKRGIKNLYNYFPIIWGTDVWDHNYLTELMDKKMEEMEKFFLSDIPCSTRAKRDGKRIRWTRKLYSLWKEEYYLMKHYDEHTSKFTKQSDMSSIPCEWDEFGEPTLYKIKNEQTEESSKDWKDGSKIAYEKDKKCYKLYIKNLSYLNYWWD